MTRALRSYLTQGGPLRSNHASGRCTLDFAYHLDIYYTSVSLHECSWRMVMTDLPALNNPILKAQRHRHSVFNTRVALHGPASDP